MNKNMGEGIAAPSPEEFSHSWSRFFTVISAVATVRSNTYGPEQFGGLAQYAASTLINNVNSDDLKMAFTEALDRRLESQAVAVLNEEMNYISNRYWPTVIESSIEIPEQLRNQDGLSEPGTPEESGNPLSDDAIKEVDIVAGSLKSIIDKLPKWAKKLIDAIMEALKLTRGII